MSHSRGGGDSARVEREQIIVLSKARSLIRAMRCVSGDFDHEVLQLWKDWRPLIREMRRRPSLHLAPTGALLPREVDSYCQAATRPPIPTPAETPAWQVEFRGYIAEPVDFQGARPKWSGRMGVKAFCRRWNLLAPWAFPSIVSSHFLYADTEDDDRYQMILPADAWATPMPEGVITLHLPTTGALVQVPWHGVPSVEAILAACDERTGVALTARQREKVRAEIYPQLQQARAAISKMPGWGRVAYQHDHGADPGPDKLLALYLVAAFPENPDRGWRAVARAAYGDPDRHETVRRAAYRFAQSISLSLPHVRGRALYVNRP